MDDAKETAPDLSALHYMSDDQVSEAVDQAKNQERATSLVPPADDADAGPGMVELGESIFGVPPVVTASNPGGNGHEFARSMFEALATPKSPFFDAKSVVFRGGPLEGHVRWMREMPLDGLIAFFCDIGIPTIGSPEQAIYRIVLKDVEQTEEERAARKRVEREWIAEYVGKRRYIPQAMVNGIRKGS